MDGSHLARLLALTHGTCGPHNMHAAHKSSWPCHVTAQAAQSVVHSMTSVRGGRISVRLYTISSYFVDYELVKFEIQNLAADYQNSDFTTSDTVSVV